MLKLLVCTGSTTITTRFPKTQATLTNSKLLKVTAGWPATCCHRMVHQRSIRKLYDTYSVAERFSAIKSLARITNLQTINNLAQARGKSCNNDRHQMIKLIERMRLSLCRSSLQQRQMLTIKHQLMNGLKCSMTKAVQPFWHLVKRLLSAKKMTHGSIIISARPINLVLSAP